MIKPDKIYFSEIRKKAEEFRNEYCKDDFPVPIEEIVEFDLGIEVRPVENMRIKTDLDAVISKDLSVIFLEKSLMENHRQLFRYRFALAHEVGHLVLHADKLKKTKFATIDEWIKIRSESNEEDILWLEKQAMEFGGRLMVPREILLEEVSKLQDNIQMYFDSYPDAGFETITSFIATNINRKFEVSDEVIKRRIINEKILEELGF